MPTCRAGAGFPGQRPGLPGVSGPAAAGRTRRRTLRCAPRRTRRCGAVGLVSAALAAALAGGIGAGALLAADQSPTPVPPKPAASAQPPEGGALGNYLVGRYAHAHGDYAAATAHLRRVLDADPDNSSLLRRTVSLLVADGRVDDAAVHSRRLLHIDSGGRLSRFVLGLTHARDGDFAGALRHIDAIKREGVYSLLLPLAEGWLRTGAGSKAAALAALAPLADRDAYRPFFLLHAGMMHDMAGRQAEAEALLGEAVVMSGGLHRPVAALGSFLVRAGRIAEARAIYEQYRRQAPQSVWIERALAAAGSGAVVPPLVAGAGEGLAEALLGVAAVQPQRGNSDAGLIYARLALFLRDDLDPARLLIGEILEDAGRLKAAVAAYRSVPSGSDFAWAARLRAAALLADLDRADEAIAALRAMADERPERSDAAAALGDVLRRDERYTEAAAAYDTAIGRIAAAESSHWRLFYVRGIAFERMGDWPRAEADFMRALELEPDQPLVLNYLGYSWAEQGHDLDEARTMIERAVELLPNDGYIVDSLGWVAYRLGDYGEAARQLERAVELQAGDPIINDHLGDAYWQVGRLNEARFQWRRVLTLGPEDALAARVRRKLADGLSAEAEAEDAR